MRWFEPGRSARPRGWVAALVLAMGPAAVSGLQEEPAPGPVWPPAGVDEVDRVVAVVGDTAILFSEMTQRMFQLQADGALIPARGTPEWDHFARTVLEAMTDQLIVLQYAKRQGVVPDAGYVEDLTEDYYQQTRAQFATDEEMISTLEQAGMNMLQYRQILRASASAQALTEQFRFSLQGRTDLPPVIVNEAEVAEFFEEQVADQVRPALISFNQIVITPTPTGADRDSAAAIALRAKIEADAGEDFAVLARRYSEDEATRDQGGELGWLRRDDLVKSFSDAAWSVRPGNIIGPVQTLFGLHVIKIENARGGERFLRHILVRPDIKESDVEDARVLAGQFADSLRAGVDPERLQLYGSAGEDQVRFDDIPVAQIASRFSGAHAAELANPNAGEVYGPFEIQRGGPTEFALVHVLRYRPEGPVELDDVRDQIRQQIRITKQIDALLREIRGNTYIVLKI